MENVNYTNEFIAKIRSDEETRTSIQYSLEGPGATEDPKGLFTVDKQGIVTFCGTLDREQTDSFTLRGVAKFENGMRAENDIKLHVVVLDKNDCTPVFNIQPVGAVPELSTAGTYVINITATDADKPNTSNSLITYSLAKQNPPGPKMFEIDPQSGRISVNLNTLDREVQEKYILIIHGTDNGPQSRNTGTGTVTINVQDVNDNIPILENGSYEASVEENTVNVEVVRIRAIDIDQVNTDNWRAVYTIITGNEAGYFHITTDPITNEGILVTTKEIDYEEMKELNLMMAISNKAMYHSSVVIKEPAAYPIKIRVLNIPEGPRFQPNVKVISISEDHKNIDLKRVITTYEALDSDTLQTATNVRYYKGRDVDNWLNINEKTAEIRLNKVPDRESMYLVNGTYYSQIICITHEQPSKTATGTIAIQVEDYNDHCPVLTSTAQTLCYEDSVVYATAVDRDDFPNAEPFNFKLVTTDTKEKWNIERLNDTTAILRTLDRLWPGHHTLALEVRDQQGKMCDVQQLHVTVCMCDKNNVCRAQQRRTSDVSLGAAGVFTMLLGLLLLILISLLLLFCVSGGPAAVAAFRAFPTDQTQHLMTYHTEGVGEDKKVPLLQFPVDTHDRTKVFGEVGGQEWGWGCGVQEGQHNMREDWSSGQHVGGCFDQCGSKPTTRGMGTSSGIALSEGFLGSYYLKKAMNMAEHHYETEALIIYDDEGEASSMGSLENICEHLHEEDNLAFLDDLGPKFKMLAELCCGSAIESQVITAIKPPPQKPVIRPFPSGGRTDMREEGGAHTEARSSASASVSTSKSTSATQIAATDYHKNSNASSATMLAHTTKVPGHTLLLQQPTMYYTSTPLYVVEQQARPTLLVATGPALGLQENVVLVDQRDAGVTFPNPHAVATLELKHTHANTMAEGLPAMGTGGSLGLPGLGSASGSGSVQIVESERVQTAEPLRIM